ncbi:uncharacterized protein LOC128518723 [Clarias gariepinus]|uniref:uncharacterized protein LOC128518723 n=1 Tax=Clarias gariepinus TaxID=13013 RepID=UPI00234CEC08|nr:uncharacterized protein LOC128518723 [Clarias gariepinus]
MKILHIYFYLLVCCGAAESFTEKSVDLGQNVTLKCEVSVKNVYWFLMKPLEPPVFILRSYSSKSLTAEYSNTSFSKRFSLQYNSTLLVHNISTNELGVYYCSQTQNASLHNSSRGIRLYIQNHENQTADKDDEIRFWRKLYIVSGIINCVVIIAVTVSIISCCGKNNKSSICDVKLQQVSGSLSWWPKTQNESSYTVVDFHPVM